MNELLKKKKKKLNGVPAEDLNQVFNEPRHSSAAVTGVDLLSGV